MKLTIRQDQAIKISIALIVLFYVGYYIFLYSGFSPEVNELKGVRSGGFGDAFGTLNAFFSGLAFSGVLLTLYFQRKDLASSQEQMFKQQTESQFYNMLSLQQNVVQSFDLHRRRSKGRVVIQGRDCFRTWCRELRSVYADNYLRFRASSDFERVVDSYLSVMKQYQGDLGLYFRSLHSLYRFVETAVYADKAQFSMVLRSLLSDYELVILFYNSLAENGEGFKRFSVTYVMFDNLDVDLLLNKEHVRLVERQAFGNNKKALELFDLVPDLCR